MKPSRSLLIGLFTAASCLGMGGVHPALAGPFDSTDVNGDNFIAVAAPFGENKYQLLIIEQLSNKRACWQESGTNPVMVDPLLLNFDFTGICGRSTDSNGYSMRMEGQDLGLDYLLRLEPRNGELVLVGSNRVNRMSPEVEIGRTRGLSSGNFQKIFLDPGWRFTRRTYQGRALGHIYLTSDSPAPVASGIPTPPTPLPPTALPPTPLPPTPLPPTVTQEPLPPEPGRELIFIKPVEQKPTVPSVQVPILEEPVTSPQTLPPPPTSDRTVPVLGN